MPRWPLVVLAALVLAVPAASAARTPCWKGVIQDWYDNGKLDDSWNCKCLQEAIDRLPEDGLQYNDAQQVMQTAANRVCSVAVVRAVRSVPAKKQAHTNWPARVSASILLVVALVLLYWRRRQSATSRAARRARGRE